jgi:succinate dehydrogenase / fumarate reductase cytochrome b subunit
VKIRLPLPGIVSILHRVSGAALSFRHPAAWGVAPPRLARKTPAAAALGHPLAKLVLIGLIWAYLHHFCAGIRLPADRPARRRRPAPASALERRGARREPALTLIVAVRLW